MKIVSNLSRFYDDLIICGFIKPIKKFRFFQVLCFRFLSVAFVPKSKKVADYGIIFT